MLKILVVGLGGFVGAVSRYGLSGLVHRHYRGAFPLGTLTVNVLGCLVIGVLMALVEDRQLFSPNARLFLLIGLLGSLTTFSTLGHETFDLLRDSQFGLALWNVAGNMVLGLVAVGVGRIAARLLGA
jgi:CrcB protein